MTSNTTNSPQQIAPPWCPWHARRTTCCRCRPDIHVAPSPQSDTREAVALADKVPLAFIEAILHGDETHRMWLLEAAACWNSGAPVPEARSTPNAGTEMLLREARDYIATDLLHLGLVQGEKKARDLLAKIDASQSPTGDER